MKDIEAVLKGDTAREAFRIHEVDAVFLFGSMASGRSSPDSDIDLAVLFSGRGDPYGRFLATSDIRTALQPLLPAFLDIVSLDDADPMVAFDAIIKGREIYRREGIDLFAAEMGMRRRFEEACHIQGFFTEALKGRVRP